MKDYLTWDLIGALLIALISGFVSISRRMLTKKVTSKLWIAYECAGVVLMTMLAMDVYPVIEPTLKQYAVTSWITQWVFVGVLAHCGSRFMYALERKTFKKVRSL